MHFGQQSYKNVPCVIVSAYGHPFVNLDGYLGLTFLFLYPLQVNLIQHRHHLLYLQKLQRFLLVTFSASIRRLTILTQTRLHPLWIVYLKGHLYLPALQ